MPLHTHQDQVKKTHTTESVRIWDNWNSGKLAVVNKVKHDMRTVALWFYSTAELCNYTHKKSCARIIGGVQTVPKLQMNQTSIR